jgi:hypothetical protein
MRLLLLSALALFLAAPSALAQTRANTEARTSPNAAVSQTIGVTEISVTYGRPSARGRVLFGAEGALAPYGAVWRTGANEASTFTTSTDLMVMGERLPAGTYGLFTIPGATEWTVIFNNEATQWGSMAYQEGEDALRVSVPTIVGPMQEQFQIRFDGVSATEGTMILHWGTVGVPVTLSTAM